MTFFWSEIGSGGPGGTPTQRIPRGINFSPAESFLLAKTIFPWQLTSQCLDARSDLTPALLPCLTAKWSGVLLFLLSETFTFVPVFNITVTVSPLRSLWKKERHLLKKSVPIPSGRTDLALNKLNGTCKRVRCPINVGKLAWVSRDSAYQAFLGEGPEEEERSKNRNSHTPPPNRY